jgi:hypothetical protein
VGRSFEHSSVMGYVSGSRDSIKIPYQETASEDIEDFMCAAVTVKCVNQ